MTKFNEQIVASNKAALATLSSIGETLFATTERLVALNLQTARSLFIDTPVGIDAVLAVKDIQGAIALQTAVVKPVVDKAVAYSSSVFEILSDSANAVGKLVEGRSVEVKKTFSAAIEKSLASAPSGSEAVVAAVKTALAQADTAYETLAESSKQVKASIESTLASANAATKAMLKAA